MRVIKFRCWDKFYKRMYLWDTGNQNFDLAENLVNKNSEIMQFTGLHDKNGKEIYEHDVMKDNSGQMFPIKYLSGAFVFADTPLCDMSPCVDCEVIGNIYEHPELLKVND